MRLLSRRKPPNFLLLLCGLGAGALGASALATGRFLMPLTRFSRFPFVVQTQDPRLFQFWILISAFYFVALPAAALVRINPLEDWIDRLPQFGRIRSTGRPRPHVADVLFGLSSLLVLFIGYLLTLR